MKTLTDKLGQGRIYRDTRPFEVRTMAEGDPGMIVQGYATTFEEPYELGSWTDWNGYRVHFFEVVDRSAFSETDMSDVIMQYNHEGRVFARISNDTLRINADEKGLLTVADLGGTEIGRQLYEEIRGGYTTKMSIGFTIKKFEDSDKIDKDAMTRTITRRLLSIGKLYDVSAVSIPANDATEISARSCVDEKIEELKRNHEAALDRGRRIARIKLLSQI